MKEIWKPIRGHEGSYEVSNLGRVRSVDRDRLYGGGRNKPYVRHLPGKVLRQFLDGKGNYLHVSLGGNSPCKNVHRLVAEAFVPNPNGYLEINHIDENKRNNSADNLEWCTRVYNNNYGDKLTSTRGEGNPKSKLRESDVVTIKKRYAPFDKSNNAESLAKEFGVSRDYIYHIARGDRWGWLT